MNGPSTASQPRSSALLQALRRGFLGRCPQCGKCHLFTAYLKVRPTCATCDLDLGNYRSDDAPPYFTILLVGHVVVPGVLMLERYAHPPEWVQLGLWLPLTLALTLTLLPRIKGAVIGWQWAVAIKG